MLDLLLIDYLPLQVVTIDIGELVLISLDFRQLLLPLEGHNRVFPLVGAPWVGCVDQL